MRLSKIKLAGFKSFVDPITIPFPSQLIGVVGPNGCGKSNIIDAVRWVMGEGSAKTLRGDSMADVIFNGSSSRKPVGNASVELIFDNSDGLIGGQYAQYAEISIKRVVSRDGTSNYFLNNTRCRRKDITDIFHGTGLGPRSYSIIEQGMISRLIEARPEELRVFLEEAAGISRYKERRKETENRIRHTRENIERLEDLRGEIEKQLNHLNRQARAAERYQGLKEEERQVRAELLALRWRKLERDVAERQKAISAEETRLEAAIAGQRKDESELERARERHAEANEAFNKVQGRLYGIGGDIARIEQDIQHARERQQQYTQDLADTERSLNELREHLARDRKSTEEHAAALSSIEPDLAGLHEAEQASSAALHVAEQAMQSWQQKWETFTQEAGEPARAAEVERTRLDHLESEQSDQAVRLERVKEELVRISPEAIDRELAGLDQQVRDLDSRLQRQRDDIGECKSSIASLRDKDGELAGDIDEARNELQQLRGRLASLEALQQAALGQSDNAVTGWLENHSMAGLPRLGQSLRVEPGWERAVETVLGNWLEAVCVDGIDAASAVLDSLTVGRVTLLDVSPRGASASTNAAHGLEPLSAKVQGDMTLDSLLVGVRAAPDLATALARRDVLEPGQSIVTPDGIWVGTNWLRVAREAGDEGGVIARAEEIRALESRIEEGAARVDSLVRQQDDLRAVIRDRELELEQLQIDDNRLHGERAKAEAELASRRERLDQIEQRRVDLNEEIDTLTVESERRDERIRQARQRLEEAVGRMAGFERQRESLGAERERLRTELESARERARSDRDAAHKLALEVEARRSSLTSLQSNIARLEAQLSQVEERRRSIGDALAESEAPVESRNAELKELLTRHAQVEEEQKAARDTLERIDGELRELEQKRGTHEQEVSGLRDAVQEARMGVQELKVRQQGLIEQLSESGHALEDLLGQLDEDADTVSWDERLAKLDARIQRLGPINLAAIDEFAELSQRKEYLDAQHADLIDALTTLEGAIRKIDRETRTRFKETFDKVNTGLQSVFPKLFGGGHAYLELTGDDLLDTGVTVMARPPGKRNSNIHLLSGGEKALTAVALIFAIFELNPSPFCMLDEVDAPLDDANVGRFCELVREMSSRVQFVMITHNKLTMELAQQLTGVTMQEPGVSRLVAVDIDEAVHMAAM